MTTLGIVFLPQRKESVSFGVVADDVEKNLKLLEIKYETDLKLSH